MKGAKYWLTHTQSRPDMFVALDVPSNAVWYGALRIDMMKFYFSAPSVHTLYSRGTPSPAKAVVKAIEAVYAIPLPLSRQMSATYACPSSMWACWAAEP